MASLFESYNARFTDLKTVAKTFVLRQEEFAKLSEHNHSLLIGPRGSGKTTLLKMLKIGAQLARTQANADISSSYMSFSAIYVGADRQLDLLLDEPAAAPSPESRIKTLLSKSLLSIRVKFSCLDTLAEVTDDILTGTPLEHLYKRQSREQLSEICRLLARTWHADDVSSPLELRLALRGQIHALNAILQDIPWSGTATLSTTSLIKDHPFIADDPILVCSSFIDVVNTSMKDEDRRWALCIDELEILPSNLQQHLFNSFRSQDQRLLLKLAASPFSGLVWDRSLANRPMEGHDFTPVNLAYANKRDARRFSETTVRSKVRAFQQN